MIMTKIIKDILYKNRHDNLPVWGKSIVEEMHERAERFRKLILLYLPKATRNDYDGD